MVQELQTLRYPTYGYRRITALLVSKGYSVGYRRGRSLDESCEPLSRSQACLSNYELH